MIYAAYDEKPGERLWYDTTEAGVNKAHRSVLSVKLQTPNSTGNNYENIRVAK